MFEVLRAASTMLSVQTKFQGRASSAEPEDLIAQPSSAEDAGPCAAVTVAAAKSEESKAYPAHGAASLKW